MCVEQSPIVKDTTRSELAIELLPGSAPGQLVRRNDTEERFPLDEIEGEWTASQC